MVWGSVKGMLWEPHKSWATLDKSLPLEPPFPQTQSGMVGSCYIQSNLMGPVTMERAWVVAMIIIGSPEPLDPPWVPTQDLPHEVLTVGRWTHE